MTNKQGSFDTFKSEEIQKSLKKLLIKIFPFLKIMIGIFKDSHALSCLL